jgi:hypothetical protein
MNLTTLSDRDIEDLLSGGSHSHDSDVGMLDSFLSEARASFTATPAPFVGKELAAMLTEGLPALAESAVVTRKAAPSSRDTLKTWMRRASIRAGVGAVGLFGFCAGMGAANALPSPAQLVVSRVAHAFSIDMPAPQEDKPAATHVESPATSVPDRSAETTHASTVPASTASRSSDTTTATSQKGGPTASTASHDSSGRGGSGRNGSRSGSSSGSDSLSGTSAGTGSVGQPNDVRHADDIPGSTTASTEVEVHRADAGSATTPDVSGKPAGGGTSSSGGTPSSGGGGSSSSSGGTTVTVKAASSSGGGH